MSSVIPRLRISIVIPAWNEGARLRELSGRLSALPAVREVIVALAGEAAPGFETPPGKVREVFFPSPNRGAQLHLGALAATGDVILFHHADSELEAAHLAALQAALEDAAIVGGAFARKFDARHPWLRWLQGLASIQQRFWGTLYGDQSVFVRREHYLALGGFRPIPLMEDVEFSRRLRRSGRVVLLGPPLGTSARRHAAQGAWRTSVQNGVLQLLYRIGVSPFRLHRWYYRELRERGIWRLIGRELILRREQ